MPFSIFRIFIKAPFGSLFRSIRRKKKKYPQRPGLSFKRPCFSRNHSNYCAVWTYWFFKGHLFDGDWLMFVICSVFLCAMFNKICLSLCSYNLAVEPSEFAKIAPQLKKTNVCLILFCCVCVFFIVSYVCWFSSTPSHPPWPEWARLVPFVVDVGAAVDRFG